MAIDINTIAAVSLGVLAFCSVVLACSAVPLILQGMKTTIAAERLMNTINTEIEPTAREFHELIHGVNDLKTIATRRVTEVGTQVEDATGNLNKVASTATRHSSVWGAGLLAGVKAYLSGKEHSGHEEAGENGAHGSQQTGDVTVSKGEENV